MLANNALERAERAVRHGRWYEAIAQLKSWLEENPGHRRAYELLALCYFEVGAWREALGPARRAAELEPDRAKAWCNLGLVLRRLGRFDEAEEAQKTALDLDPGYHRARLELSKIARDRANPFAVPEPMAPAPAFEPPPPPEKEMIADAVPEAPLKRRAARWREPVAIIVCVLLGWLIVSLLCHYAGSPGKRGWRTIREGLRAHVSGRYAAAIRLYQEATEAAPGLAVAHLARGWAELELNPFGSDEQQVSYNRAAEEELWDQIDQLVQQAKWGQTAQLDRADAAATAALAALERKGPGYQEQEAAGFLPAETTALAFALMAGSALVRSGGALSAFEEQFRRAVKLPGSSSANLGYLRRSSALADAIAWCRRAEECARQADTAAPEMHLGGRITTAARELAEIAVDTSYTVAHLEETVRSLEVLDEMLRRLAEALAP